MRSLTILSMLLVVSLVALGQEGPKPTTTKASEEIQRLIADLGNPRFEVREQAARALDALGEAALPALEKAAEATDAEVRTRAAAISQKIRSRVMEGNIQKLLAQINEGGIDQFIDQMVLRKGHATDERWQVVTKLAEAAAARAAKVGGKELAVPMLDLLNFPQVTEIKDAGYSSARVLVDGFGKDITSVDQCVVLSSGPIEYITGIDSSIVFVNGNIKGCTTIDKSVIICNGSIGYVTGIDNSIIIATGDLKGSTTAEGNFFQVKSVGRHTSAENNVYVNLKQIPVRDKKEFAQANKLVETEQGPLQMFKFHDWARLGVDVVLADGEVRIEKLDETRLFAKAGFQKGDRLLAIDGTKLASVEDFRKQLRCRNKGEEARFQVQRGDRIVEVLVKPAG